MSPKYVTTEITVIDLTEEQLEEILSTVNTQHGNIQVIPCESPNRWRVEILDDNGKVEFAMSTMVRTVKAHIWAKAFSHGWVENPGDLTPEIDLGQFDPWDLGMCIQLAAFGDVFVS